MGADSRGLHGLLADERFGPAAVLELARARRGREVQSRPPVSARAPGTGAVGRSLARDAEPVPRERGHVVQRGSTAHHRAPDRARCTETQGPADVIQDAAVGKASATDALRAAIQLQATPAFNDLRGDQMFRHAIETGSNKANVQVEGVHTSVHDFVCSARGGSSNAAPKDPENALPHDSINPALEAPLNAGEVGQLGSGVPADGGSARRRVRQH